MAAAPLEPVNGSTMQREENEAMCCLRIWAFTPANLVHIWTVQSKRFNLDRSEETHNPRHSKCCNLIGQEGLLWMDNVACVFSLSWAQNPYLFHPSSPTRPLSAASRRPCCLPSPASSPPPPRHTSGQKPTPALSFYLLSVRRPCCVPCATSTGSKSSRRMGTGHAARITARLHGGGASDASDGGPSSSNAPRSHASPRRRLTAVVVAGLLPGRRPRRECMRRLVMLVINLAGRGFSALLPAARPWPPSP